MKHTPGPWKRYGSVICGGMTTVVEVYLDENDEETEANARLIAAAPELLDALRSVEAHCEHPWVEGPNNVRILLLGAAQAAIAKVEGR